MAQRCHLQAGIVPDTIRDVELAGNLPIMDDCPQAAAIASPMRMDLSGAEDSRAPVLAIFATPQRINIWNTFSRTKKPLSQNQTSAPRMDPQPVARTPYTKASLFLLLHSLPSSSLCLAQWSSPANNRNRCKEAAEPETSPPRRSRRSPQYRRSLPAPASAAPAGSPVPPHPAPSPSRHRRMHRPAAAV
jgi:hypothetical protein